MLNRVISDYPMTTVWFYDSYQPRVILASFIVTLCHYCHIIVTLLSHYCHIVVTLLSHYCHIDGITLESHMELCDHLCCQKNCNFVLC